METASVGMTASFIVLSMYTQASLIPRLSPHTMKKKYFLLLLRGGRPYQSIVEQV